MANPKVALYTTVLYTALTSGEWSSDAPSKAVNKAWLSWSDLLRKFRKHCTQLHEMAEIASQTQALSLFLIRAPRPTPEALDGDHTNPNEPLTLGDECLLPEEHRDEAQSAYLALTKLPKSDSVHLAIAYHAFALGRYNDALSHLSSVKFDDISTSVNVSHSRSVSSALSALTSRDSVTTTNSPTGGFTPSIAALDAEIKDGKIWRVSEKIRGRCHQGMAYESLPQPSLAAALVSYESALPLLDHVNIPKSLPSTTGKASDESFTRYRELWRWVERLLWRASILSAKARPPSQTLPLLRAYQAHSVHWPAAFRPEHRSTIAQLHLHALVHTHGQASKSAWLNEVRSLITDYRILLTATTSFPRAGHRNVKVEEFVDLCVAAWDVNGASGEQAAWVIDVLWWATRFTFNSHRIYRHLTRTLYVSGDTDLARRTLRLYVQIVSKARERGTCEETERVWVETLVQGARMLCRVPGGVDEAREAGALIQRASESLDGQDTVTVAALKRAKGVWHACMALREQEPLTRPAHLAASLTALTESLALHAVPSTHFHLALALARPGPSRDLAAAVACAREAVEGDPNEIRHWHLLGLLLAAAEDWRTARGVLQAGADVGDRDRDEPDGAEDGAAADGHPNGHAAAKGGAGLLPAAARRLPHGAALQRAAPDHPPPTRHERFEHALQLRLTQLALLEHVDGPERTGDKWAEVFAWVGARRGLGEERRAPSVEPPPSEGASDDRPARGSAVQPLKLGRTDSPPRTGDAANIPINLIPPSPQAGPDRTDAASLALDAQLDQELLQERDGHDTSTGRRVQRILKERVQKGQGHIHSISRRIGRGSARHGARLTRASSAPDFHAVLSKSKPYQASSIHSRQRLSATYMQSNSPPPPPPPPPPPATPQKQPSIFAGRSARERRLLSNLWLTSAATFRRMGKIDQAKAAIQEAEVADEENEDVWVQLGLYFAAQNHTSQAIASFHKALFIAPEHVPAFVHLAQQYLAPVSVSSSLATALSAPSRDNIDIAAGLLSNLTRGVAWDVPEAWYFLARAFGLQGKRERERECLGFALGLVEGRGLRDIKTAVGWCL